MAQQIDASTDPVSSTKQANGQVLQQFQQWDPQQWFDTNRWTLTGSQADSDYKAGMWWSDAQDMQKGVPALQKHAESWTSGRQQLVDALQKVRAARARLTGYAGKSEKAMHTALDHMETALSARMDAVEKVPEKLNLAAQKVSTYYPTMQALWNKWENDRANAPVCHEDTVQMQQPISNMAQSFLDAADAIMKAYNTELAPPTVTTAQPGARQASSNDSTSATASPATSANGTTTSINGISRAGSAPGTLVTTPTASAGHVAGLAAAGAGTTAPATHPAATLGHVANVAGNSSGAHVAGTIGGAHSAAHQAASNSAQANATQATPTLAGAGAGTLAPPTPTGMPAAAPMPAATGSAATTGAGAFVPFLGAAPAGAAPRTSPSRERTDRDRTGAAMPVTPPLAAGGKRTPTTIRPGVAKPSGPGQAAVAGVLRGRTGGAGATGSMRRRVGTSRCNRGEERDTVQFLDEDAWQTDDAGSGVVAARAADEPTE